MSASWPQHEVQESLETPPLPFLKSPSDGKEKELPHIPAESPLMPPVVALPTPTFPLRDERLKRRISIEDMAQRLCLRVSTVQAIENETWDRLTCSPTYTVGFIHAYGRLLQRDNQDIVSRFRHFQEEKARLGALKPPTTSSKILQKKPSSLFFAFSFLVSAGLIFAFSPLLESVKTLDVRAYLGDALMTLPGTPLPPVSVQKAKKRLATPLRKSLSPPLSSLAANPFFALHPSSKRNAWPELKELPPLSHSATPNKNSQSSILSAVTQVLPTHKSLIFP